MLGEPNHLQHTPRDHGRVTATAVIEQARCLGTESFSGLHGTTYGYSFALKVAVTTDGIEPFNAAFRAYARGHSARARRSR